MGETAGEGETEVITEFDVDEEQADFFEEIRVQVDRIVQYRHEGEDIEPGTYKLVREEHDD